MRVLCFALFLFTGMLFANCQAALVLDDLSGYSNNFDFLNSNGSENFWSNDRATQSSSGDADSGSPGWYWQGGSVSSFFYGTGNPGTNDHGAYSLQSEIAGDNALGSYAGGSYPQLAWGLVLQNNTGSTIGEVEITFTGEQYRRAETSADRLTFSFKTSATEILDTEPSAELPAGWQSEPNLDFEAPLAPVGPPFFAPPYPSETLTETLLVNLPAGHYLGLRWHDTDVAGNDAALAIDDLTLSFTIASVPEPSAVLFGGLVCGLLGLNCFRKRLSV